MSDRRMKDRRRYRSPPANAIVIMLAAIAGVIAVTAVVVAVAFATRVNRLALDNKDTLEQISANRLRTVTDSCTELERLKGDLRAVLQRFHVKRGSLPQHADRSYALDPVRGGCARRARELVAPPPKRR